MSNYLINGLVLLKGLLIAFLRKFDVLNYLAFRKGLELHFLDETVFNIEVVSCKNYTLYLYIQFICEISM